MQQFPLTKLAKTGLKFSSGSLVIFPHSVNTNPNFSHWCPRRKWKPAGNHSTIVRYLLVKYFFQLGHHLLHSKYDNIIIFPKISFPQVLPGKGSSMPQSQLDRSNSRVQDQPPVQLDTM